MRIYNLSRQEKPYFCIPACLQAILRSSKIELPQTQIAREVGCSEDGVMDFHPVRDLFLRYKLIFSYFDYNKTPVNDPAMLVSAHMGWNSDVMICYPNNNKRGHTGLVLDFKEPRITFQDPGDLKIHERDFFELLRRMYEVEQGGFGIVSGKKSS